MSTLIPALALLLALLIDHVLGEPPVRWHPVVWIGNYLQWAGDKVQHLAWQPPTGTDADADFPQDFKAFWLSALYWCAGAAIFSIASWVLQALVLALPAALLAVFSGATSASALAPLTPPGATGWLVQQVPGIAASLLAALLLGILLKPLLACAMLKSEVLAVEAALAKSLQAGRERLSWLVSRDVSALSAEQVRESAIESLAENLNDSVVAPLFWFVLLGLPGAALYRFANTADAMWGYRGVYRGKNWEWAGKWAAYVDDLLNWLPARLTGCLLLALARPQPAVQDQGAIAVLHREAQRTPSPNSGWPMAAMALALHIRLGKPGIYVLNAAGRAPAAADTQIAIVFASKVALALIPIYVVAIYFIAYLAL